MSVIVKNILYVGNNLQLVNTVLNLSDTVPIKPNYYLHHISWVEDIQAALAEKEYSHFICDLPLKQAIARKIAIDFPLLETTYLGTPETAQATELSVAMQGLVSDEIKETLDYLSIPIYFKNKKGQFLACNHYFSQLFGLAPEEVVGKTAAQVVPAELFAAIDKIDQKVFAEQRAYFYECRIQVPGGEERDVVFRKESVANGSIQIGMVFDITEVNQTKNLLEKERVMLLATADISADIIFFKDLQKRYLGCNKKFEKLIGYSEQEIIGKTDFQLFEREQALRSRAQDKGVITNKLIYIGQEPRVGQDGAHHLVEIKKMPLLDKQGDVQGLIAVGRDITAYDLLQKRLKIADEVFENAKEVLLVTDEMGIIISVNKMCCAVTAFSKEELLGAHISIFAGSQQKEIDAALQENKHWQGEVDYLIKTGQTHFGWLEVYTIEHSEKHAFNYVYSLIDFTQSLDHGSESKFQFFAKHDPLTGLFNRVALFNRLEDAIARANHKKAVMAVILVDINGFKAVNEQYGHNAGDAVLQEIAARLKSCIFEKDTVARFGDDEFVIIVDELANELDAAIVAQKIAAQFDRYFAVDNLSVQLSATIGIALCPDDGIDVDTLLSNAEKAMLRGKSDYKIAVDASILPSLRQKTKKNKQSTNTTFYHFYTKNLTLHSRQQVKFEEELKQALLLDQFELYYQPLYDLNKRQIVALEAVLCWNHPQRGALHLDSFSSLAEHSGLGLSIALMVIRKAAMQAVAWHQSAINFGRIAISLTEVQLSQRNLIADLQTIFLETKCSKEWLEFEIDEVIFKSDNLIVHENLLNFSKMGIALIVDKFGEDRVLLKVFEQLEIDKFKISKHFTEGASVDFVNHARQDALFVLARSLGMTVVSDSLGNMRDGPPLNANKFSPDGKSLRNKAMRVPEITFYLRCHKRK